MEKKLNTSDMDEVETDTQDYDNYLEEMAEIQAETDEMLLWEI